MRDVYSKEEWLYLMNLYIEQIELIKKLDTIELQLNSYHIELELNSYHNDSN